MTQDEIIRMAREAGLYDSLGCEQCGFDEQGLERFAALVAEATKAQPQGEPVVGAYEVVNESGTEWELVYPAAIHKHKMIPEHRITQTFYTTPPVVPQGEPVAWAIGETIKSDYVFSKETPLYTTPPSVEAAIEATKEKAAKVCDECFAEYANNRGLMLVADKCAAAIRSMK